MSTTPTGRLQEAWIGLATQWLDYTRDAAERGVLFMDVMRKRGNDYMEHATEGKPALLKFAHALVVDGHTLPRPTNYSLLHILPSDRHPATDEALRPIVVVDPRAGHGPGLGGFKEDSEIGVALRTGHPVYFVTFGPEPVPGQTLEDVAFAESHFIQTVQQRHPDVSAKPAVIGNCQAGWAVAALASVRPDIMGPILLNGAPLSYWAGSAEQNPMRYSGGSLGGTWLSSLASDLGGGQFDGVHLVENFERLNPANTYWAKNYNLFSHIDTEEERYLEFERWWGGYFRMTTQEIESIVENLFVGNKLSSGTVHFPDHDVAIDLRNISAPVVVFASWGDNITPPQQALGWIADVWGDEKAIVVAGRTIVYMLHENIGHLGIFVGGAIARKEHDQTISTLDQIELLPPGLYEMVIENRTTSQTADKLSYGNFDVRFDPRTVADIRKLGERFDSGGDEDEAVFSTIAQVSSWNASAYKTLLRPLITTVVGRPQGELLMAFNPSRLQHHLMSDANPLVKPVRDMAKAVRENRNPLTSRNVFSRAEKTLSRHIVKGLDFYRDTRDATTAQWVETVYGPLGMGAFLPPDAPLHEQADARAQEMLEAARAELEPLITVGGFPEGLVRMVLGAIAEKNLVTRRSMRIAQIIGHAADRLIASGAIPSVKSPVDWMAVRAQQARILALFPEQAMQAIPQLMPNATERTAARMLADRIMLLDGADSASPSDFAQQIQTLLQVQEPRGASSDAPSSFDAADAGTSKAPAKRKPRTRKAT